MRKLMLLAGAGALLGFGIAPGFAQTRVFVSGSGSDANPCSLAAPCRSFQQAHNTVLVGGEIVALDAAGYGPLTINRAVTVTAIGIEASITSNNTASNAITIDASPNDMVTIRGLTLIQGLNTTGNGIVLNSGKSVAIRDCSISGFITGIYVGPSSDMNVELHGVTANNNAGYGLDILPSGSPTLNILVTDSSFNGNVAGGVAVNGNFSTGKIAATLNIDAAGNLSNGVNVTSTANTAQPVVMVTGSKLVNNGAGLLGNGNVRVLVDRTQISGNAGDGWQAAAGAVVDSYKNNAVNGNANDGLNGVVQISSE